MAEERCKPNRSDPILSETHSVSEIIKQRRAADDTGRASVAPSSLKQYQVRGTQLPSEGDWILNVNLVPTPTSL